MEFGISAPDTVVTARNRNRSVFASTGVMGGRAGANSTFTTNPDTAAAIEHGNVDVIKCGPGDVVRIVGPGAGGYGPPAKREPDAVLHDWRCGFVSADRARVDNGVAIEDGAVETNETARLRAGMAVQSNEHFDQGASRTAFERIWTSERYDMLTAFLAGTPVVWRHFLKHRVFAAVEAQATDGLPARAQMSAIFDRIRTQFPSLDRGTAPS